MNYVHIDVIRYAATVLTTLEKTGDVPRCERQDLKGQPCSEVAEYLVPDAARPGGGGRGIEARPA